MCFRCCSTTNSCPAPVETNVPPNDDSELAAVNNSPTARQEPSAPNSLASDLAEIYFDLKDALKLLASGKHIDDVYWEWRFDFRERWARHTVESIKVALFLSSLA
jgi:uncharacterized protein DUF5063